MESDQGGGSRRRSGDPADGRRLTVHQSGCDCCCSVSAAVIDDLRSRGHSVIQADRWSTDFGRAQLIYRMEDGYLAASERRTDGQAVGF